MGAGDRHCVQPEGRRSSGFDESMAGEEAFGCVGMSDWTLLLHGYRLRRGSSSCPEREEGGEGEQ